MTNDFLAESTLLMEPSDVWDRSIVAKVAALGGDVVAITGPLKISPLQVNNVVWMSVSMVKLLKKSQAHGCSGDASQIDIVVHAELSLLIPTPGNAWRFIHV